MTIIEKASWAYATTIANVKFGDFDDPDFECAIEALPDCEAHVFVDVTDGDLPPLREGEWEESDIAELAGCYVAFDGVAELAPKGTQKTTLLAVREGNSLTVFKY